MLILKPPRFPDSTLTRYSVESADGFRVGEVEWDKRHKIWLFDVNNDLSFYHRIRWTYLPIKEPGPQIQDMPKFLEALEKGLMEWVSEREAEVKKETKEANRRLTELRKKVTGI